MQYSLEKNLEETVSQFEIEDRACGIIMNAKTGAILAMATAPGFNLNEPSEVPELQIAQAAQAMELLDIDKKEVIKILKIVHRINRASLCFTHQHLVTRKPSLHIKNHLIGFTQQSG